MTQADLMNLKVSRQTVQQATVSKLRAAILSGYFKPGSRLVEAELCRSMGVSRTSVREALRRLEAERLVTNVPNRGLAVAAISWEEAEEIYQVRAMLEGEAAAMFAARATPDQLRVMRAALRDFESAVNRNDAVGRLEATTRFYDVMLGGCGNSVIAELLQGLVARINFLRARSMSRPGRARHSAVELRRMLVAAEKRNAEAARKAAVEHVRAACEAARESFEDRQAA